MLAKAKLVEVKWQGDPPQAQKVSGGKEVPAQFNPQTLKINFSNENRGGGQPGGSATQYVGSGTSKMAVELLFDTTADGSDVRENTKKVAYFIQAKPDPRNRNNVRVPPGLSFEWGSFIFRGVVNTMDETLDYFSEEGVPLRATIALSISRPEIEFISGTPGQSDGGAGAGSAQGSAQGQATGATTPLESARQGDSVQRLASRNGKSSDWKAIASANNIDDPLRLSAGALLNVNAKVNLNAGISLSANASASAGASAGANIRAGANASTGARASAGASASAGTSASAGANASAGISTGVSRGR
jgi:hypothetical protein